MTDTSSLPPRDDSLPGDWLNAIHQGDCLQVLAQLPDESVDLNQSQGEMRRRMG